MKIFISWSGERSNKVASALKEWLADVFQGDEIFMSAHDIEAGARWGNRLNSELEESSFGIVCLTLENLNAPWLLFEAGALSKAIRGSHVVPYLLEVKKTDVTGPLAQFQGVSSDEEGTFKLVQSINETREKPLTEIALRKGFDKWWTDLNARLAVIPSTDKPVVHRDSRELIEEILQILRSQSKNDSTTQLPENTFQKISAPTAFAARQQVRKMLANGTNIDSIENHVVEEYGLEKHRGWVKKTIEEEMIRLMPGPKIIPRKNSL